MNILHGEALPSFPPLHHSQRHSLVLFVTDQCIYPCGKMSLPPGLGFSFPLNHPCCAGEGLANCLFSQVAPGDGCPTACHTAQLHSQGFPQPQGLLCQTNEHSATVQDHGALCYISSCELKKQRGGHLKREGRTDHGLPARRGDAGNLLVCASCWDGPQNGTEAQISCPGQTSRGKGIAQGFCCHCCLFTSQESGECFGWKSSAAAAKEAELEDGEGNQ